MGIARHIRKLEGYVPGEQPKSRNVVKLNTNENPYPPSPRCAKVLSSFNLDDLRRYPDPNFSALAKAIADENGTTADRVFVGNGSDEILSLAARVFVENDESIGSLDPSYSLYKTLAAIRDVKWVGTPIHSNPQTLKPFTHLAFPLDEPQRAYGRVRRAKGHRRVCEEVQGRRDRRRGVCRFRAR